MIMRGPSAEALASLEQQLEAAIAEAGTRKAAQVGDDLFGLAVVLRSTASLRRILTDVSIDGRAKQQLVAEIVGGKVDPVSLDLARAAVAQRWSATRDLADVLEHLSEVSIVHSAGDDIHRVVDELFAVSELVQGSPELRDALADPSRSVDDKVALVDGLLAGKVLASTNTLVKQSLAGSYRTMAVALATYQRVAARAQQQRVATVVVAQPLSETERDRLAAALTRQYGREVHLNIQVDPDLIGGVRVEIGDDVIDGSVVNRLAEARRRLAG